MTSKKIKHHWQAQSYHHHSSVQNDAATQLLQYVQLKGHEQILDVGCGDGKITAAIAKCVPTGRVVGIDVSPEMTSFARKSFPKKHYPNLTFLRQDAQHFNYCAELDIVFSSFALQWVPDPVLFFRCAAKSLKPSGRIAATIPLGISSELEKAISVVVSIPKWFVYFKTFSPKWYFITDNKYKQLLIEHQFMPLQFNIVPQTAVFSSRKHFEDYVIQWFSYLHPLPQNLKQVFFKQVIDKYLEINPALREGKVGFKFLRLDFIANKIIL
ncbi:MAG: class I SAM-dependent methyltransferase [Ignavibacteriae bacterium]|nr:class I SAM-dependent methyltransferase [Ignavibacteriota bacterium]